MCRFRVKSKFVIAYSRQYGQAMAETVIIMSVLLLLVLGIVQFALIYNTKTTLNYAVFEATRAGAVNYGNTQAIQYAFAGAMSPVYASVDASDSMLESVNEVKRARNKVYSEIQSFGTQGSACFEQLNPLVSAFNAHQQVDDDGREFIPNDHLKYRSADDGGSNVSIQDANLLKLRVTYCYPLYVPLVSTVIKQIKGVNTGVVSSGGFNRICYSNDGIPIVAQAIVRMQTPIRREGTFMGNTCG